MSVSYNDKPNIVEVSEDNLTVTVISSVGSIGPQGIQGPQGPQGPEGPEAFIVQPSEPVNTDLLWLDSDAVSSNSSISSTIVNAKGDLIAATANDAVARLGVGVDDTVLMARSSESTGLVFAAPRLAGGAARPLLTAGARLSGSGLVLGGIASNFASSPDSAALSITGDIDIKVKVAMADWTPAAQQVIVGKYQTNSTRSYVFSVEQNGRISLYWSTNGTATDRDATSTVATGVTDGAIKWVRATLDVDDGSGNHLVKFYLSDNGTSWTQLGTTVTTAGTTSIFDSTSQLEVGSIVNGTANLMGGTVYDVIIQSAYDTANNTTSLQYDANFETATADALAFTETANSATVTINTTRYNYGVPNRSLVTVGTVALTNDSERVAMFNVTAPITVDMIQFEVTSAPASTATARFGIYAADNDFQGIGAPLVNESVTVATSVTGNYYKQFTGVTLQPGAYVILANTDVEFTVRTLQFSPGYVRTTLGTSPLQGAITLARTAGSYPTPAPKWNAVAAATTGAIWWAFLRWSAA